MTVRSLTTLFVTTIVLASASSATARSGRAGAVTVTSVDDSGPGSLRAAVERANADPDVQQIVLTLKGRAIALTSTVDFTGRQPLILDGQGAVLDGGAIAAGPAFRTTGGGDLTVRDLTVRNAPGEGIDVEVPPTASGLIRVSLAGVDILGNKGHGVLVNDQEDSSTTDGVQPNANGSAASVAVALKNVRFAGNGFSVSDRDGLRVNEGGPGSLYISGQAITAADNAADGIEVDERGTGDVHVDIVGAHITGNGVFDPSDLDDGFDIDEYDEGSVYGRLAQAVVNDNYEEGLDFNENNAGDLRLDLYMVEASGNREEGIDYEEDDDFAGGGDLVVTMTGVIADRNGADDGDAGLKIREKGVGALRVAITDVQTVDNLRGGISIREDAEGSLAATIARATSTGNAGHGIDFDENRASTSDAGDLTAAVTDGVVTGNIGAGVRADQQTPGAGALTLTRVTNAGNVGGATSGGGVPVTTVP